jgi:hypothetical protein
MPLPVLPVDTHQACEYFYRAISAPACKIISLQFASNKSIGCVSSFAELVISHLRWSRPYGNTRLGSEQELIWSNRSACKVQGEEVSRKHDHHGFEDVVVIGPLHSQAARSNSLTFAASNRLSSLRSSAVVLSTDCSVSGPPTNMQSHTPFWLWAGNISMLMLPLRSTVDGHGWNLANRLAHCQCQERSSTALDCSFPTRPVLIRSL